MNEASVEELPVVVDRDVAATMRDGTVLRADVYRPGRPGPYPVLLCRTPYDKRTPREEAVARSLAARGYIVPVQDLRGRYASDGHFDWQFRMHVEHLDGPDGYDSVEWAAGLADSDGRVGTWGVSYAGWTGWLAAGARPPHLGGIIAGGMPPRFLDWNFGIFDIGRRLQWVHDLAAEARGRTGDSSGPTTVEEARRQWHEIDRGKWIWFLPLIEIPEDVFSTLTPQFHEHLQNQNRNPWDLGALHSRIQVPICATTNWYDRCNATIYQYVGMVENGSPDLRDRHRLIVGPWSHSQDSMGRHLGVRDFGPAADLAYADLVLEWYDHLFKGVRNALASEAPVRLFIMGANHWRTENEWPLARTRFTDYFLRGRGAANTPAGDGGLSRERPAGERADRYTYDPRDPVMSLMSADFQHQPCDQAPLRGRNDILVYQTPPLEEDIEVTGPVTVKLWASTSAPDTDFTAKLIDVDRDGQAVQLCFGLLRCRYRDGFDRPSPMTPDEPYELTIRMLSTANVFKKGHRIRLDISSSDFPNFDRNHNTGADYWSDAELRSATQTVFHDRDRPSQIILPVIPAS